MRGLSSAQDYIYNLTLDLQEGIAKHWFSGIGSRMNGVYLLLPFTRLSLWIEWREVSVGFGHDAGPSHWEFFAGRLQGVLCIEPATGNEWP